MKSFFFSFSYISYLYLFKLLCGTLFTCVLIYYKQSGCFWHLRKVSHLKPSYWQMIFLKFSTYRQGASWFPNAAMWLKSVSSVPPSNALKYILIFFSIHWANVARQHVSMSFYYFMFILFQRECFLRESGGNVWCYQWGMTGLNWIYSTSYTELIQSNFKIRQKWQLYNGFRWQWWCRWSVRKPFTRVCNYKF